MNRLQKSYEGKIKIGAMEETGRNLLWHRRGIDSNCAGYLRADHAAFTVSSLVPESRRLGSVALSLPTIINRDGIDRVLSIPLIRLKNEHC